MTTEHHPPSTPVPEDALVDGSITITTYIEPSGQRRYVVRSFVEMPLSQCLGMLELAKFDLIERCDHYPFDRGTRED